MEQTQCPHCGMFKIGKSPFYRNPVNGELTGPPRAWIGYATGSALIALTLLCLLLPACRSAMILQMLVNREAKWLPPSEIKPDPLLPRPLAYWYGDILPCGVLLVSLATSVGIIGVTARTIKKWYSRPLVHQCMCETCGYRWVIDPDRENSNPI